MRRAVVVGSGGQDGSLLSELLLKRHYQVAGVGRERVTWTNADAVLEQIDITNANDVSRLVRLFRPDEIYYLAAFHKAAEQRDTLPASEVWRRSFEVHVVGLTNFLEALLEHPSGRLFYACSSQVFGQPVDAPQTEDTPPDPRSPYSVSKAAGWQCCRNYRRDKNIFACTGILYNHESPLRSEAFVSQKIVRAVQRIRRGEQRMLKIGDLAAEVDWGYAPDFVRAMAAILELPEAADFVIATGRLHSVRDFVSQAFGAAGLDWREYVHEAPHLLESAVRPSLVGDSSKLRRKTAWKPSVTFEEMVRVLVNACETSMD